MVKIPKFRKKPYFIEAWQLTKENFKDSTPKEFKGVLEIHLLEIVRHRLQCFQQGEFATNENAIALTHVEEALLWMNKRVEDRA